MQRNTAEALVFFHFSDIHFQKEISTGVYDLNQDVRNEIKFDAARLATDIGTVNGILISGDIAFAGQPREYEIAQDWLNKLCSILGCPPSNILVAPGNHDVDRQVIEQDRFIALMHKELRACPVSEIDHCIEDVMQKPANRESLYRPIQTYLSTFASRYGCEIGPERPFWERDFPLNDGSTLRFRGINSTLVSDCLDDEASNKLVVGSIQATLPRQEGVVYAVLCHHPPGWLREQDEIEDLWNARVALQLFGHKHRHRIRQQDNRTVIVSAGAAHPNRREPGWQPFYSAIKIWVAGQRGHRKLVIQIFPRLWDLETHAFAPWFNEKGEPHRQYELSLPPLIDSNPPRRSPVRVFIADDFFPTREGLCTAIETLDGFEVVGDAASVSEIFTRLEQSSPDIVIIDLKWFDDKTAGQSAIAEIKRCFPHIKLIAITAHEALIEQAFRAGADAALPKTFSKENIADVLEKLAKDGRAE